MNLKTLPAAARPRERLLALGPAALADAELVALLLRTGVKGIPVLELAQRLLDAVGGLTALLNATPQALKQIKGLGPAKRAELAAVMEMARRSLAQGLRQHTVFESPRSVKHYAQMRLGHLHHEVFGVLFLDSQNRLIEWRDLALGTLNQASVYPREVVRAALDTHAAAVILAHNHPSGVAEPSVADRHLTQALRSALALVDVQVLDHLVVGGAEVCSFAEEGWL
jgi:DNA repair protein RadC